MIGTFVNVAAIIIGSLIGSVIKSGLGEKYQTMLYDAMGMAAVGLGLAAVIQNLPHSTYPVLFIASLAIGGTLGTYWDLEQRFKNIVARVGKRGQGTDANRLGQGLATAIMLFCIGTLSILGPINSALYGNHTYLFTNATLDFVTSMVLATTYGLGIAFAAVVLFVWQGSLYLLAHQLVTVLDSVLMTEISIVGGFLIFGSGLAILGLKPIKSVNMLPALLVPVIWVIIVSLWK